MASVRISDIRYVAGGNEILNGVNAVFPEGKIGAIVGPSGAGKSTLLRTINRLIEPTQGEIYLDSVPTSKIDPLQLRRRVGMVFQLPALFGDTVEGEILYGARLANRNADAGELLQMVGLGASFKGRDPQTLSVGQQQRVSIARALALEPEVLLMDEPTSALDRAARQRVEELIMELNSRLNLTIILVSHDLGQVERVSDRVLLLIGGRSEGEWNKEEFFSGEGSEQVKRFIAGSS